MSYSLPCPPTIGTPRTDRPTLGHQQAQLGKALGFTCPCGRCDGLMPHQRHILDVAGEYELIDGRIHLAYRKIIVLIPRQSGKTTLVLVVVVHRGAFWPIRRPQNISYTAQTGKDASDKWLEQLELLEKSALRTRIDPMRGNGKQQLRFTHTGSKYKPVAVTSKSGHGPTLDLGFIDEAWAQEDYRAEQGMRPSMITRLDAQLWVPSTAGTDRSTYLLDQRQLGRDAVAAGLTHGVAYFEWSMPDGAEITDEDLWWQFMPALGHTISVDTVRAEIGELIKIDKLGEAERAYGNRFTNVGETVIPAAAWHRCAPQLDRPFPGLRGPIALGVEINEDRSAASIGAADRHDAVEIVDHHPGTWWVVDRVAELVAEHHVERVVIDGTSPARSLVHRLRDALPDPDMVVLLNATEAAAACGDLYDAVVQERLRHLDQPELNEAVSCAGKRSLADAWAWSRSRSAGDVCPLVAVTYARWSLGVPTQVGGIW